MQIRTVSSQSHNYGKKIILEKPEINKKTPDKTTRGQ
jgi:hypothetical protein